MYFIDPNLGNYTVSALKTKTVNCAEAGIGKVLEIISATSAIESRKSSYYLWHSRVSVSREYDGSRQEGFPEMFLQTTGRRRKSASYRKHSDLSARLPAIYPPDHDILTYFWTVLILVTGEIQMEDRKWMVVTTEVVWERLGSSGLDTVRIEKSKR